MAGARADHTVSLSGVAGRCSTAMADRSSARRATSGELFNAGASVGGHKTFTDADGSKIFARYAATARGREARGTFEFTGGTGRRQGIAGRGEYRIQTAAAAAGSGAVR